MSYSRQGSSIFTDWGLQKQFYRSFPAHIQDLKYSVESNGKERREVVILEGISGSFAPGKRTAVVSGGHAGVTLDQLPFRAETDYRLG